MCVCVFCFKSKNKDLTEECNKLRKIKLEEAEEKSKLEELLESVRLELDQTKQAKDKSLESLKVTCIVLYTFIKYLSNLWDRYSHACVFVCVYLYLVTVGS